MLKQHKPKNLRRPHPLYPEPGAWVLHTVRGLPEMQPPEPLPRNAMLEAHEIRDQHIAYEGLGYCIYELIPVERIADRRLAGLWGRARLAMREIVEYLETVPSAAQQSTRRPMKRVKRR